jgi:ribosomal peptide maturation radical SAM protein 1
MIYLINMPFASITYPNLALGLFKAQFNKANLTSKIFDFNFTFARMIGYSSYQKIGRFMDGDIQLGEWLFSPSVWDNFSSEVDEEFLEKCTSEFIKISKIKNPKAWISKIRTSVVPAFLKHALEDIKRHGEPEVVGFTCSFFQTTASLGLGRLIKEHNPNVKLVYGGANFHSEMGEELIKKVPWIDAVSLGEADDVIVPLFKLLAQGDEPSGLQGICYRGHNNKITSGPPYCPVSSDVFSSLPDPDFDDYFSNAQQEGWTHDPDWQANIHLFFEGTRGCWWGQKCQCTYCGLNGDIINYRQKPGQRVYETIQYYVDRYPFKRLQPTDNNMAPDYFETLLPLLAKSPFKNKLNLLYELRAGVNRGQIKALVDAGIVYLHPGIENFSTHILKLIRKGLRGIDNIYFLKLCREFGIITFWNYLVRVPGERSEDYKEIEQLIPKIVHLQPPCRGRTSKIECVRFSPYYFEKDRVENIRPKPWYRAIFPPEYFDLSRCAYFFDADWKDILNDYSTLNRLIEKWCRIWQKDPELPKLIMNKQPDGTMIVTDTREKPFEWIIEPDKAAVYGCTQDLCTIQSIMAGLRSGKSCNLLSSQVQSYLDEFESQGLVVKEKNTYLGLALPHSTPELSLKRRWTV